MVNGKVAGGGTVTIRERRFEGAARFDFSAVLKFVSGASKFQTQAWEAETMVGMEPVTAALTFGAGANAVRQFELLYREGKVWRQAPVAGVPAGCELAVDVPADIVDQRVDWAAVMSLDLAVERKFAFHVYDPKIGVSAVTVDVSATERVNVPAGNFEVYRVTTFNQYSECST